MTRISRRLQAATSSSSVIASSHKWVAGKAKAMLQEKKFRASGPETRY